MGEDWTGCLQMDPLLLHCPVLGSAAAAAVAMPVIEPGLGLGPQPPAAGGQGCCVSACVSSNTFPEVEKKHNINSEPWIQVERLTLPFH